MGDGAEAEPDPYLELYSDDDREPPRGRGVLPRGAARRIAASLGAAPPGAAARRPELGPPSGAGAAPEGLRAGPLLLEFSRAVVPLACFVVVYIGLLLEEWVLTLEMAGGLGCVIVGLALFKYGLTTGLMPFGESIGRRLPQKAAPPVVFLASLLLGVLVTFSEPGINSLQLVGEILHRRAALQGAAAGRGGASAEGPGGAPRRGDELLVRVLSPDRSFELLSAVACGVGVASACGLLRLQRGWSIKPIIFASTVPLLCLTAVCWQSEELSRAVGLAWDCGAITTGPATVPIVLSLGIGAAQASRQHLPAAPGGSELDGFGIVTLASLVPVTTVLAFCALCSAGLGAPTGQEPASAFEAPGSGGVWDEFRRPRARASPGRGESDVCPSAMSALCDRTLSCFRGLLCLRGRRRLPPAAQESPARGPPEGAALVGPRGGAAKGGREAKRGAEEGAHLLEAQEADRAAEAEEADRLWAKREADRRAEEEEEARRKEAELQAEAARLRANEEAERRAAEERARLRAEEEREAAREAEEARRRARQEAERKAGEDARLEAKAEAERRAEAAQATRAAARPAAAKQAAAPKPAVPSVGAAAAAATAAVAKAATAAAGPTSGPPALAEPKEASWRQRLSPRDRRTGTAPRATAAKAGRPPPQDEALRKAARLDAEQQARQAIQRRKAEDEERARACAEVSARAEEALRRAKEQARLVPPGRGAAMSPIPSDAPAPAPASAAEAPSGSDSGSDSDSEVDEIALRAEEALRKAMEEEQALLRGEDELIYRPAPAPPPAMPKLGLGALPAASAEGALDTAREAERELQEALQTARTLERQREERAAGGGELAKALQRRRQASEAAGATFTSPRP